MPDESKPIDPKSEVTYMVMPTAGKSSESAHTVPLPPPVPSSAAGSPGKKSPTLAYIIIAVIVLLVLAALAYFLLGIGKKDQTQQTQTATETSSSKLPKNWIQQYFSQYLDSSGNCQQASYCGDDSDPENDGLSNYQEFIFQTKPMTADTDSDGLADGDEVNIYGTDATKKYTDPRDIAKSADYNDALSIKNGYDPLTPGLKLTDTRLSQIQSKINTFHLHEPTLTTLQLTNSGTSTNTSSQTQTNKSSAKTLNVVILGNVMPNVTINSGDTIVWTNKDETQHEVASDPHPTHTDVPGLQSTALSKGQTYSFTFTKVGIFGYHDHLNPTLKGTITVK